MIFNKFCDFLERKRKLVEFSFRNFPFNNVDELTFCLLLLILTFPLSLKHTNELIVYEIIYLFDFKSCFFHLFFNFMFGYYWWTYKLQFVTILITIILGKIFVFILVYMCFFVVLSFILFSANLVLSAITLSNSWWSISFPICSKLISSCMSKRISSSCWKREKGSTVRITIVQLVPITAIQNLKFY